MKKLFSLAMVALTMSFSACTNDLKENAQLTFGDNVVTATTSGVSTRTTVDGYKVLWASNDEIGIFYSNGENNYANNKFKLATGQGTQTATFAPINITGTEKVNAYYPYQQNANWDGNKLSLTLPAEYEYNKANQMVMVGDFDEAGNIGFKNASALVMVTINNFPTGYTKAVFTANNSEKLNGAATVENGELKISSESQGTSTITIKLPQDANEDSYTFYFPIAVGTYTNGLKLTLVDGSSNSTELGTLKTNGQSYFEAKRNEFHKHVLTYSTSGTTASASSTESVDEVMEEETNVALQEVTEPTANIVIPAKDTEEKHTLTIGEISEETTSLNIKEEENASNSIPELDIFLPTVNEETEVNLSLPNATVALQANGNEAISLGEVTASTAENTLIVGADVTIKKLIIEKGNVVIYGKVEEISSTAESTKVTVKKGATLGNYEGNNIEVINENNDDNKLTENKVLNETWIINDTVTIDLNGYKIIPAETFTATNNALIVVANGAKLIIKDSSNNGNGMIDANNNDQIYAAITLTSNTNYDENKVAELIVEGGTLKGYYYAIAGNGNRHNTKVTINGGTLQGYADDATAIYHPQNGTLIVNDGIITGGNSAIEMRAGTLIVNNGTLTAKVTPENSEPNGSGTTIAGAAVAVSQHSTDLDLNVTIKGGIFNGCAALYEKDVQNETATEKIKISVTGGTLDGKIYSENCSKFISGGTFTDASVFDYLSEEASIKLGKTITLAKTITIKANTTLNFDLNGHDLSYAVSNDGKASAIFDNRGTLNIVNTGDNKDAKLTFTAADPDLQQIPGYATNTITNESTLTISENVTVCNGSEGGASYAVDNKGVFTLNGGKLIGDRCALRVAKFNQDNVFFKMNSGLIEAKTPAWIHLPGSDANVKPTITVEINDGTLQSTKESNADNNVMYTYSYGNSHANTKITINGGNFLGGTVSIGSGYKGDAPTLIINGGTFEYDVLQWLANDEYNILYKANKQ
ncbi:MAG: hypothetical protein E7099_05710 [Mediterranea massiliensis]|nr:hypothetical protein [Mediterranea massiliensis]